MNKKAYISPETLTVKMEMNQMIAFSGGDKNNGVKVSSTPDEDDSTPNRSRQAFDIWDSGE